MSTFFVSRNLLCAYRRNFFYGAIYMADLNFRISPNVILGAYATSRLGQFALAYGTKFMLIIDPVLKSLGTTAKIAQALTDHNVDFFTFDSLTEVPETKTIEQALQLARQSHIQGIIAVGGGKTIHIARAVCALFNETKNLYDYVEGAVANADPLNLICVPTTNRDALLFTNLIPVVDSRSSRLALIHAQNGLCKEVIFDSNLTITLSEKQIGSMAQEILCLATEAYLSQKATFFSDMFAEKAIELIGFALDENRTQSVTVPQAELLAQSGCMASLAAAASSIGPASLLSMSINARYRISRALITSILFPYTIEDYSSYKAQRLAKLMRLFHPEQDEKTDAELAANYAETMRQRLAKLNLPARLKDLSVSIEQLTLASEDAGKLELINAMPRSMTSDDLFTLIKSAY